MKIIYFSEIVYYFKYLDNSMLMVRNALTDFCTLKKSEAIDISLK